MKYSFNIKYGERYSRISVNLHLFIIIIECENNKYIFYV